MEETGEKEIEMGEPAARVGDAHTCPLIEGGKPHAGGPVLPPGAGKVLIGGAPAARDEDKASCAGPTDSIIAGSTSVKIQGKYAARKGDKTTHGGEIETGFETVKIG